MINKIKYFVLFLTLILIVICVILLIRTNKIKDQVEKYKSKLKENGSNLVLVRNREQFLSEFGGLLFLIDEIIKFKKITDMEIEQMETVKNRQK